MFGKKESLVLTDPLGQDIAEPFNVEYFYATGAASVVNFSYSNVDMAAQQPIAVEGASQADSPVPYTYLFRSCYYYLKEWVESGSIESPLLGKHPKVEPPFRGSIDAFPGTILYQENLDTTIQGVYPTAVEMGWPNLSSLGLDWNGNQYVPGSKVNLVSVLNNAQPVDATYFKYTVLLPRTFLGNGYNLGNDLGGIPTPEMTAALMTVRGYNTYIQGYDKNDMVCLSCSAIPLSSNASTQVPGDPRPTIEERWVTCTDWLSTWDATISDNITNKWMLSSDIFPYDNVCYTNRGVYQASLLNSVHGLPD
jgi:hypothetical protein